MPGTMNIMNPTALFPRPERTLSASSNGSRRAGEQALGLMRSADSQVGGLSDLNSVSKVYGDPLLVGQTSLRSLDL